MSDQEEEVLRDHENGQEQQREEEETQADRAKIGGDEDEETKIEKQDEGEQNREEGGKGEESKDEPILEGGVVDQKQDKEKSEEEEEYKPRKDSDDDVEETPAAAEPIETVEVVEQVQPLEAVETVEVAEAVEPVEPVEVVEAIPVVENDIQEYKPRRYSQESEAVDKAWAIPKSSGNTTDPAKGTFASQFSQQNHPQTVEPQKPKPTNNDNPLFRARPDQTKPLVTHEPNQTDKLITNYKPQKFDQTADELNPNPKYSITMAPEYATDHKEQMDTDRKSCACLLF